MGCFLRRFDARLGKSNKKTKKENMWISMASPSTRRYRRSCLPVPASSPDCAQNWDPAARSQI